MKAEVDALQLISGRDQGAARRLAFTLPESKFQPPEVRPGIVLRAALVERLTATAVPVITVAAPPGYGKTTLMAQWARRTGSRVAWLSCDDGDNDPVVLLSALALALDRIGPVDPASVLRTGLLGRRYHHGAPVHVGGRLGTAAGYCGARPSRGGDEQAVPDHDRRVRPAAAAWLAARAGLTGRSATADGAAARSGRATRGHRGRPGHGTGGSPLFAERGRGRGQ